MKRYIIVPTILFCLLAAACKKDKQIIVNGVSANKGSVTWNTTNANTGFKPLATKDTLFIEASNGEENLVLAIKQNGVGTYQPNEFKAYFYTIVDLDALASNYQLANNPANTITITDYDETTHVVKATFNLQFKSTYRYSNTMPDELTFTDGKINTQLTDVFLDPFK